jgi:hypothetical protein
LAARSSQKEAALPAKGNNSSTAAKNKNLIKCQECNRQCKEADQAKPPGKSPHQGREIITIDFLENGAFCTVFSENFHKF